MCRRNLRLQSLAVAFVCSAALGWLSPSACGQQLLPVFVSFEFSEPEVTFRLKAESLANKQQEMSDRLAASLLSPFPYWNFQRGGPNDYPRMQLKLEKHGDEWHVAVVLLPQQGLPKAGEWRFLLYPEGEIGRRGVPGIPVLMNDIEKAVQNFLADEAISQQVLEKLSEAVPLGKDLAQIQPAPTQQPPRAFAVLPLRWEISCKLASSEFLVTASQQGAGRVTLHSVGSGESAMYKPDDPQFPGLLIEHVELILPTGSAVPISQSVSVLPALRPLLVRLKKYKVELLACQGAPGQSPAPVAPPPGRP